MAEMKLGVICAMFKLSQGSGNPNNYVFYNRVII